MMAKFIFLCEKAWRNSALSVARFWGCVKIDGMNFNIIGERHDLVREDWCKIYKRLGREQTINGKIKKIKENETNQTDIEF